MYEEKHNISKTLRDYCIRRLLNENKPIFNRVIHNNQFKPLLFFMKQNIVSDSYNSTPEIISELKRNPDIMENIRENMYIDKAIHNMEQMESMDRNAPLYKEMYDKMVSVGEFLAIPPLMYKEDKKYMIVNNNELSDD